MMAQALARTVTYHFTVPAHLSAVLKRIGAASGQADADVLAKALALYELALTAQQTGELNIAILDKNNQMHTIIEGI